MSLVQLPPGYHHLRDLKSGQTCNIYGVVKYFSRPAQNKRNHGYSMCIAVTDQSLNQSWEKLVCIFFGKNSADFPSIDVGDVIRFNRLEICMFNGGPQGKAAPGFTSVVFPRDKSDPRPSKPGCGITTKDHEIVKGLLEWSFDLQKIDAAVCPTVMISECKIEKYYNIICQVIGIKVIDSANCVQLMVTDGTTNKDMIQRCSGLATDVLVFDDHVPAAKTIKVKDYIKLFNVHAAPYHLEKDICRRVSDTAIKPTIDLCLHRGTKFGRGLKVINVDLTDDKIAAIHDRIAFCPQLENVDANESQNASGLDIQVNQNDHPSSHLYSSTPKKTRTVSPILELSQSPLQLRTGSVGNVQQVNNDGVYFTLPNVDNFHSKDKPISISELKLNNRIESEMKVTCRIQNCRPQRLRDCLILHCDACLFVSHLFPKLSSWHAPNVSHMELPELLDLIGDTDVEMLKSFLESLESNEDPDFHKAMQWDDDDHDVVNGYSEIEAHNISHPPSTCQIPNFNRIFPCVWHKMKPADVICGVSIYFCPRCASPAKTVLKYSALIQIQLTDQKDTLDCWLWSHNMEFFGDTSLLTIFDNPELVEHIEESLHRMAGKSITCMIQPHRQYAGSTIYEITDLNFKINTQSVLE
ncbi:protection of telomeres protein 1-like [Tubulanus polymorphus]|uniref:protection of telomeres protein 1-like n=1 Tax=Tubulanus polymorphus TaxID=672921 RepID=UPI003DA5A532